MFDSHVACHDHLSFLGMTILTLHGIWGGGSTHYVSNIGGMTIVVGIQARY